MLKKLFGGIKMTWIKVIVFAVLAGAFTALMALLVPDGSSFHQIAVTVEAWILFAIVIICNCDKPLEAACKTFVFFLISQPLVYLIQVPFHPMGWQLFGYYRYWFFITLLTFPGAFLGWYIKKDNIWSALILSVMLVLLVSQGVGYLKTVLIYFPRMLFAMLFCFGLAVLLIFGVLHDKKARIVACAITLAAVIACSVLTFGSRTSMERVAGNVLLENEVFQLDESWSVSVEDPSLSTGEIRERPGGGYELFMHYYKPGENIVTLTDGEGNEYQLRITLDEENNVDVIEPKE